MSKGTIVGLITFGVFMTEAIIHYNIGANGHSEQKGFKFPPKDDLIKSAIVTALFSFINGALVHKLVK
jgi:hypothetical protein